jgi:hypothetical protein
MILKLLPKYSILFVLLSLVLNTVSAQSYKKDSLQIKVYTEISYKKAKATNIKLKKVFCDYCSETQTESIGEEALRRADSEKYHPENKLENGKKRLAIYIRISKNDFKSITKDTKLNIKLKE